MKLSIGDLRELTGPKIRFTLNINSDGGDPLMSYPGWTINQFREIESPATKTNRGFWKRFTVITEEFEKTLLDTLESFQETDQILGPRVERPEKPRARKIKGEREIA